MRAANLYIDISPWAQQCLAKHLAFWGLAGQAKVGVIEDVECLQAKLELVRPKESLQNTPAASLETGLELVLRCELQLAHGNSGVRAGDSAEGGGTVSHSRRVPVRVIERVKRFETDRQRMVFVVRHHKILVQGSIEVGDSRAGETTARYRSVEPRVRR